MGDAYGYRDIMADVAKRDALRRALATEEFVTKGLGTWVLEGGERLVGVHGSGACVDSPGCPLHRMTKHHMRDMRQHWNNDISCMERICEHGVHHVDPDESDYEMHSRYHECSCGCCKPPKYTEMFSL